MESKSKVFQNAIRQTLTVFPVGLLATGVVFDLLAISDANPGWSNSAFYMIGGGVVGGFISALIGLVDWAAESASSLWPHIGNLAAFILFGMSWYLRVDNPASPANAATAMSFAGAAVLLAVYRLASDESRSDAPDLTRDMPAA